MIDILHQVIRANYEQAAIHGTGGGDTYEVVADLVARAVCASWSSHQRHVGAAEFANTIGSALARSENALDIDSPAHHAIRLVRQQIQSMGNLDRR